MTTSLKLPSISVFNPGLDKIDKNHSLIHSLIFKSNTSLSPINCLGQIKINSQSRFIKGETILSQSTKKTTMKEQCKKYAKCKSKIIFHCIKKSSLVKKKNEGQKELSISKGIINKKTHDKSKTIEVLPVTPRTIRYVVLVPKKESKKNNELTKLKTIILSKFTIGFKPGRFWQIHFNNKTKTSRNPTCDKTGITRSVIIQHIINKHK